MPLFPAKAKLIFVKDGIVGFFLVIWPEYGYHLAKMLTGMYLPPEQHSCHVAATLSVTSHMKTGGDSSATRDREED